MTYNTRLTEIVLDAVRERQVQDERPMCLTLDDVTLAFRALKQHIDGDGDLFIDTEPPTDDALLLIFAFLVLP